MGTWTAARSTEVGRSRLLTGVALGLVALLAGLYVWWLLDLERNATGTELAGAHELVPAPPGDLDADSVTAPGGLLELATPLTRGDVPAPAPPPLATVLARVSDEDGIPLEGIPVWVRIPSSTPPPQVDSAHARRGEAARTDRHGRARISVDSSVPVHLACDGTLVEGAVVDTRCPPLEPGEQHRIEVTIARRADRSFFGQLVDGVTGDPISRAAIHLIARADDWAGVPLDMTSVCAREPRTRSGSGGEFEVSYTSFGGWDGIVHASGYGVATFPVREGFGGSLEAPFKLRLWRAARLEGQVTGKGERPATRVQLRTAAWRLPQSTGGLAGSTPRWSAQPDEQGWFVLEDLPPRVPLRASVWFGDEPAEISDAIQLERGETRQVTWTIGAGTRVFGRVVREDGTPVEAASVWLLGADQGSGGYLDGQEQKTAVTRTLPGGEYELLDVSPGLWKIALAADDELAPDSTSRSWAAAVDVVQLSRGTQAYEHHITAYVGHVISGRVLAPDDQPVAGAIVTARGAGANFKREATCEDGGFELGPLLPGTYELTASGPFSSGLTRSERAVAPTGSTDVRLELRAAASLAGRVVDAEGAGVGGVRVHIQEQGGDRTSATFSGTAGGFEFMDLAPGHYHVVACAADQTGFAAGVELAGGARKTDIEVALSPNGFVRVHYQGSADHAGWQALRGDVILATGTIRSGRTVTAAAPAGALVLQLTGGEGDGTLDPSFERREQVEIVSGETAELKIKGR